ncbi:hypothetical protein PR202_gb23063 [Eleusine coracana subsp. coracana]|uniref:Uncharacterized protein n=1 Tax=Eleusine coracana subsp. coracana TaxID=191504 RepID=A0AAV5FIH4_ELECO|nr:hypothetical protein PR202_gb23063 [Eleusine coracana subsp. coracana]
MEDSVGNNEFLKDLLVPPPIQQAGDNDPVVRPPPKSILLDPFGYISPRANGSTARGFTTDGHAIQVTFWPVPPPRISCFTVHCPGLPEHRFSDYPKIVTTVDDLVLLRVNLHPPGARLCDDKYEYFVYQWLRLQLLDQGDRHRRRHRGLGRPVAWHPPLRRASGQPPPSLRRAAAAAADHGRAAQGPAVVRPRHRRRRRRGQVLPHALLLQRQVPLRHRQLRGSDHDSLEGLLELGGGL